MTTQHHLSWPEIKDLRFLLATYRRATQYKLTLAKTPQLLACVGHLEAVVARCQGERRG